MKKDIVDITLEKISKMNFKDSISYLIKIQTEYATNKRKENYFLSYAFLSYIKQHLDEFKLLIKENEEIKNSLKNLFKINSVILDDNLVSIIIDDKKAGELLNFLNEYTSFEDYYLNDTIMSFVTPENKNIFEQLQGSNRKYLFALTNSITISEEEQKEIYTKVLKEYPEKFINDLFIYSNIIKDNTPNEFERYNEINKGMFKFTESVISNPNYFYNYMYNIREMFSGNVTEKDFYNTFQIILKYSQIHEYLLSTKINNREIYDKLKIISTLPPLKEINTIEDLNKFSISEIYKLKIDESFSVNRNPDSADARSDYQFVIFNANREVVKITDDEIQSVELPDDDTRVIGTEYSHISGLRRLYPEYGDKEVPGEIIVPANAINHDIILITEGDSMNMWLPNIDNISMSQIEKLEEKLKEISEPEMICTIVATECDGNYLDIPFSTREMLIEYLKNNKKVK